MFLALKMFALNTRNRRKVCPWQYVRNRDKISSHLWTKVHQISGSCRKPFENRQLWGPTFYGRKTSIFYFHVQIWLTSKHVASYY